MPFESSRTAKPPLRDVHAEFVNAQQEQTIPYNERVKYLQRQIKDTLAEYQYLYDDLLNRKEDQEILCGVFAEKVFEYLVRSTTGRIPLHEFQLWYCVPFDGSEGPSKTLPEEAFKNKDVPYVEHPLIQAQIIFLKVIEQYQAKGLFPQPKKLIGGVIDTATYTDELREILPKIVKEAAFLQREYDAHSEASVRVFDYELRETIAAERGYEYVGCFRGYGGLVVKEDLAEAIVYHPETGERLTQLIRRDGTPLCAGMFLESGYSEGYFILASTQQRAYVAPSGEFLGKPFDRTMTCRPLKNGYGVVSRLGLDPREKKEVTSNFIRAVDGAWVFKNFQKGQFSDVTEEGIFSVRASTRSPSSNDDVRYFQLGDTATEISRPNTFVEKIPKDKKIDGFEVITPQPRREVKNAYPIQRNILTPDGELLLQQPYRNEIEIHPGYFLLCQSFMEDPPSEKIILVGGTEIRTDRVYAHGSGVMISRRETTFGPSILEARLLLNGESYPFESGINPLQLDTYPHVPRIEEGVIKATLSLESSIFDPIAEDGGIPRLERPLYYTIFGQPLFQVQQRRRVL